MRAVVLVVLAVFVSAPAAAQEEPPSIEDPVDVEDLLRDIDVGPMTSTDPPGTLRAYIQARCRITLDEQSCVFTNSGNAIGHACAEVMVSGTGETRSRRVCSEPLEPGGTVTRALAFDGAQPASVCTRDGSVDFDACRLSVEMSNVGVDEGIPLWAVPVLQGLVLLIVILTTVWVYFDARKRGDPNAGMWVAGALLLWIAVFPAYLFARRRKTAAARMMEEMDEEDG